MRKHFKKIIGGVVALLLAAGSQIPVDPTPLTIQEYQALIEMYDYEVKIVGGMEFTGVDPSDFEEIMPELNKKIRARKLSSEEIVALQEEGLTKQNYKDTIDTLMDKVERNTLLEILTEKL